MQKATKNSKIQFAVWSNIAFSAKNENEIFKISFLHLQVVIAFWKYEKWFLRVKFILESFSS